MKRNMLSVLITIFLVVGFIRPVFASGDEPYIGEVSLFASNFAPRGYAFCEGQILQINQNTALFALLGTKYGGDGRTTFALPDLRAAEKSLGGVRYIIALRGLFPPRN